MRPACAAAAGPDRPSARASTCRSSRSIRARRQRRLKNCDRALVLFGRGARGERAQVAAAAGSRIHFPSSKRYLPDSSSRIMEPASFNSNASAAVMPDTRTGTRLVLYGSFWRAIPCRRAPSATRRRRPSVMACSRSRGQRLRLRESTLRSRGRDQEVAATNDELRDLQGSFAFGAVSQSLAVGYTGPQEFSVETNPTPAPSSILGTRMPLEFPIWIIRVRMTM